MTASSPQSELSPTAYVLAFVVPCANSSVPSVRVINAHTSHGHTSRGQCVDEQIEKSKVYFSYAS